MDGLRIIIIIITIITKFDIAIFTKKIKSALQKCINSLIATLKSQSNGPSYTIQLLVHWPFMGGLLHLVQ